MFTIAAAAAKKAGRTEINEEDLEEAKSQLNVRHQEIDATNQADSKPVKKASNKK